MKREQDLSVDLTNCESEPIRTPGAVQPHGLLFVVDRAMTVMQVSENVHDLLGLASSNLLNEPIANILVQSHSLLEHHLQSPNLRTLVPLPITLKGAGGKFVDVTCIAHDYPEYYILEFEPVVDGHLLSSISIASLLNESFMRLQDCETLAGATETAAQELKQLTGYDRVMVYRFDKDWHGEVIAESKNDDLEPLIGLHYPASDIPVQARELYKKNLVRVIADVDYNSSPVTPLNNPKTDTHLDMSDCVLRSVSPIHIEYLKNMGVHATLTISLMVRGELWGLIACHHYSPKMHHFAARSACQLFGQTLALAISAHNEREKYRAEVVNIRAFDDFLTVFRTTDGDIIKAFELWGERLIETFDCSGVALLTRGKI